MTRHLDWTPLTGGSADPVPGDGGAVADLARAYARTASEIRTQAGNLRRLASGDGWDSDDGRAFGQSLGDLASKLGDAEGRYERTGSALSTWAGRLGSAQTSSYTLLVRAREARATMAANAPPAPSGPPPAGAPEPTEAQVAAAAAAERKRSAAHSGASGDLRRIQEELHTLLGERDTAARTAARAIRDAADNDALKDSRWERMKNWVAEHKDAIKWVADKLSTLATILAVVALFVPGVNVFALGVLAAIATGGALIGHGALAAAGEGSWVDVGLDAVGLLTFGYGAVAGRSVARGVQGVRAAGTRTASKGAQAASRQANREVTSRASRTLGRPGSKAARRAARGRLANVRTEARRAGSAAARRERDAIARDLRDPSSIRQRAADRVRAGGDDGIAQSDRVIRGVRTRQPSPRVDRATAEAARDANRARRLIAAGGGSGVVDQAHGFDPLKDRRFTHREIGGSW